MSESSPRPTEPGWWFAKVRQVVPWYAERSWLAILIGNIWIVGYGGLYWVYSGSSGPPAWLIFLAGILTSEGYFFTVASIGQWAGNSGTRFSDALEATVATQFASAANADLNRKLTSAAQAERPRLQKEYNRFVAPWRLGSATRLRELNDACARLAERARPGSGQNGTPARTP